MGINSELVYTNQPNHESDSQWGSKNTTTKCSQKIFKIMPSINSVKCIQTFDWPSKSSLNCGFDTLASFGTNCQNGSARELSRLPERFNICFKTDLMLCQVPAQHIFQPAVLYKLENMN